MVKWSVKDVSIHMQYNTHKEKKIENFGLEIR